MHLNWFKKKFLKVVGDDLSDFIVNSKVNPTALTKKTNYLYKIFEDRMMLPFMSVKMAKYLFEAVEEVKQKQDSFKFPIIIFHGKLDTVTNFEDSKHFIFNKVRPFKEFHLFPQGYHELQHDNEKDDLLEKSLQFIKKLPNLKNFGPVMVHPIRKAPPSKRPLLKIIILLIAIIALIRKFKK